MDAKRLATNEHGQELRYARRQSDRWPGWDSPLGKAGYWIGDGRQHTYLGRDREHATREAMFRDMEPV